MKENDIAPGYMTESDARNIIADKWLSASPGYDQFIAENKDWKSTGCFANFTKDDLEITGVKVDGKLRWEVWKCNGKKVGRLLGKYWCILDAAECTSPVKLPHVAHNGRQRSKVKIEEIK